MSDQEILKEVRAELVKVWEEINRQDYNPMEAMDPGKFGQLQGILKVDMALEKKFGNAYGSEDVRQLHTLIRKYFGGNHESGLV